MPDPIRIAFVKFGGLAAGGTERWLQMMAANLPRDRFAVDYFYCDTAPYIGSDFQHPGTDPARRRYMEEAGVNLVEFSVRAKDVTTPTHDWVDTNFWDVFSPEAYDFVQTAKAGPAEYPYCLMDRPIVEYVTLSAGVDRSSNLALSIHLSQWQRREWARAGGDLRRSDVIPIPAEPPASAFDLREELGIPAEAAVAGFHQRAQDEIFSPIPLAAFKRVWRPGRYFAIMGGSALYRRQAAELGLQDVIFVEHDGRADRISRFLNTLDVFAHGRADGETFGTVFAEAMMHSKPCLSHRSPVANAQPETMGAAGLFADGVTDYATKLEALLEDRSLHDRLAGKARAHAERYYSLDSCVGRLGGDYEELAGRPPSTSERPVPYGWSDLGFLLAGPVDEPSSVAHHVVAGRPPQDSVVDLLPHLLPPGSTHHELGSANSVLILAGAVAAAESVLHTEAGPDEANMRTSVGLNNLEARVSVEVVATPAATPVERLRTASLVTINSARWAQQVLPRLALEKSHHRPALLLNLEEGGSQVLAASLSALGYECRPVGKHSLGSPGPRGQMRPGWFICLHPDHHQALLAALPNWAAQRRNARRQRMLSVPGQALRPARRRAGALAYRLRSLLPS